eukprot:TRINITY_DN65077_c0_g1_i1.p2 TRINITY_DN65077_c0_g1~~TRINITY_DN65077_c0_g1_i1.p2  ORF type:complete len:190 (-),score=70.56 TRINITY_DN65077_c0_g1_i1:136-705(-)
MLGFAQKTKREVAKEELPPPKRASSASAASTAVPTEEAAAATPAAAAGAAPRDQQRGRGGGGKAGGRGAAAGKAAAKKQDDVSNKLKEEGKAEQCKPFEEHAKDISNAAWNPAEKMDMLRSMVLCCRVQKCWKAKIKNLQVAVKPGTSAALAWEATKSMLASKGAQIRRGQAPRSNLERVIQDAIDSRQ